MATNGTLVRGAATFAAGKFGSALAGGVYDAGGADTFMGAPAATIGTGTLEVWLKTTATSTRVAAGRSGLWWIATNASGMPWCQYGTSNTSLLGTTAINDGAWHHVAVVISAGAGSLYVDGTRVATSGIVGTVSGSNPFQIGAFGSGGATYDFYAAGGGMVDEVRISTSARYSGTTYTVPTAAFTVDGTTASLWHLDGDATDATGGTDTTPPTVPTGLGATPSSGQVALTWTASTDNIAVAGYKVYRGGTLLASPVATSYTDTGLTNGTTYSYAVSAVDSSGNESAQTSAVTATPTASVTLPGQVTGLTAGPGSQGGWIVLAWSAPSNGGSPITDYQIEYKQTASGTWLVASHAASAATTITLTGLTNGTSYDFRVSAINSVGAGAASATASATPTAPAAGVITPTDPNIIYSPYTWDVTSARAFTICAGAYLRTTISGSPTAISLTLDTSTLGGYTGRLAYRFDGGGWTLVPLAATISLTIPTSTTAWPQRVLEVVFDAHTSSVDRWDSPYPTALKLTGINVTPSSCATVAIPAAALRGLVFGDSITEGVNTITTTGDNSNRSDAIMSNAFLLRDAIGAEVGVVGFGGQGLSVAGGGSVPIFGSTWNLLAAGITRSLTPAPDFILINHGTNDGSTNITAAYTAVLNSLLAATPSTTRIIAMRPVRDANQAANIQAAVAACTTPTRVTYLDTTGWFVGGTDSSDGTHPWGFANLTKIAPRMAAAVRTALASGGVYIKTASGSKRINGVRK